MQRRRGSRQGWLRTADRTIFFVARIVVGLFCVAALARRPVPALPFPPHLHEHRAAHVPGLPRGSHSPKSSHEFLPVMAQSHLLYTLLYFLSQEFSVSKFQRTRFEAFQLHFSLNLQIQVSSENTASHIFFDVRGY
jgi:hypothetical protein